MTDLQHLAGRPCYESDKGEYGMIEVRTCMDDTEKVCCLSKGETGIQRIGITNWRSHVSTVEVRIRSLNEKISLIPSDKEGGSSFEYVEEAHIAPSKATKINEYQFQVPAKRESDNVSKNEIIQLSMTVNTEQAAEGSREGPTLHSEIQFK